MTQPAPEPSEAPLTMKDLLDGIAERSGVDFLEQAIGDHAVWFPPPTDKSTPTVLAIGQPMPMRATLTLYFLFQDEGEIRAYAGPGAKAEPGAEPEKLRCYTFSKRAPVYFVDLLPAEAFVQLVADECLVKAEGSTTAERERELVVAHIGAMVTELEKQDREARPDAVSALQSLLTDLENEDHLGEEEAPDPAPDPPAPAT